MRCTGIKIGITVYFMLSGLARGQAPSSTELVQVRQEMGQLKQEYEQMSQAYAERLSKLDERLKQLEKTSPPPELVSAAMVSSSRPAPAVIAESATPAHQVSSQSEGQAAPAQTIPEDPTDSIELSLSQQQNNPVRERMETVLENFVDVTGYFRAGYGRDGLGAKTLQQLDSMLEHPTASITLRRHFPAKSKRQWIFRRLARTA